MNRSFALLALVLTFAPIIRPQTSKIAVTTYHYDNLRTGWNSHETILKQTLAPSGPVAETFGLLHQVTLDDTTYAQPLLLPNITIAGAKHDVVYAFTENNTVYAIDAGTGAILLTRNLGAAVPPPQSCNNNGPRIGIESTPVIDQVSGTIYLVAFTNEKSGPTYRVHALDISTLADKVPTVAVTGSHTLANGTAFAFAAKNQRQRAALLMANGNIYAGFASWCDHPANQSRGWLLGWQTGTLKPLAANTLVDRLATGTYFLSTIWMSGYGVASDAAGSIYFATGNTAKGAYNTGTNLSESVVKVSPDLTKIVDFFTPSNVNNLDGLDQDLAAGGVLLLPDTNGAKPQMAAAAGKDGRMFVLDRDNLGGFNTSTDKVLTTVNIDGCHCGNSYYLDKTYAYSIVSSGGRTVKVWKVNTSPAVSLSQTFVSENVGGTAQDGGFFTAVSSSGSQDSIIWAVSRPNDSNPATINLWAFAPVAGTNQPKTIFKSAAGDWNLPSGSDANANIVPVVANGHVYVSSYKQLAIFGFGLPTVLNPSREKEVPSTAMAQPVVGVIRKVSVSGFTLHLKSGEDVEVDATEAERAGMSEVLEVGRAVAVIGTKDAGGLLHASVINRSSLFKATH